MQNKKHLPMMGVYLWAGALFRSKIDSHITENRLATTGVYDCADEMHGRAVA